jgi:hypothetical protein
MSQNNYFSTIMPFASQVEQKTGIPAELVAAWWSWETDYGKNRGARELNNHAGIKKNSRGNQKNDPVYAGYNTLTDFANDFSRTLLLPYDGYKKVIATAQTTKDYAALTKVMNDGPWAEADYNISTITQRAKEAAKYRGVTVASGGAAGTQTTAFDLSSVTSKVNSMSNDELIKFAGIGAAVVALIALVNE